MTYLIQLGTYQPITDTFTMLLDLNDGIGLDVSEITVPPPPLVVTNASNPRLPGDRVTQSSYGPRIITIKVSLGPATSTAAMQGWINTLTAIQEQVRLSRLTVANGYGSASRVALALQPPTANAPYFADIAAMSMVIPEAGDIGAWTRLQLEGVVLTLHCAPFLRGQRLTLQNLVANAGKETPAVNGVPVFADTFATLNAYTTLAGANPGRDVTTYADAVQADAPQRYFRMDETSGTTFANVAGPLSLATSGSVTLGVAGGLTGDSDKAASFDGTSGYASGSMAGVATGNASYGFEAIFRLTTVPTSAVIICGFGNYALTKGAVVLAVDGSGRLIASNFFSTAATMSALTAGVWYHAAHVYDGTTMSLYINGVLAASTGSGVNAITAGDLTVGAMPGTHGNFFPGQIDEVAVYTSLSPSRIAAHVAAMVTAPTTNSASISIPAGTRVAVGSPAWTSYNAANLRLRAATGMAAMVYFHYQDANNYLVATVSMTTISVQQVIAGSPTTVATAAVTLAAGGSYWLVLTQFRSAGSLPPAIQAQLLYDLGGQIGAVMATAGPHSAASATIAVGGQLQLAGVNLSNASVYLFGPGGWSWQSTGTGICSGSWEQNIANTYGGGPVPSIGCTRMDLPPAGTVAVSWSSADTSSPTHTLSTAIPVVANTSYHCSDWVRSVGVSNGCQQGITVTQYDIAGVYQSVTGMLASVTGSTATWTNLNGNFVTGATTAYVVLNETVADTIAGASANGTVWYDNAQVWQTSFGATMPYCEMRFPVAPGTLLLSGLKGDVPAPCLLGIGGYPGNGMVATNTSLNLYAGRRGVNSGGSFVNSATPGTVDGVRYIQVVDNQSWGGYQTQFKAGSDFFALLLSGRVSDLVGIYHLLLRARNRDASPTSHNLQADSYLLQHPWLGNANNQDRLGLYQGPFAYPFSGNSWSIVDAGQVVIPAFPINTLADATQLYATVASQITTNPSAVDIDWGALLPVDGDLIAVTFQNPTGSVTLNGWVWLYVDGLSLYQSGQSSVTWSLETMALPGTLHAGGGFGTVAQVVPSVNSSGTAATLIDPTLPNGVNQWVIVLTDGVGTVIPATCHVTYAPLYLSVR